MNEPTEITKKPPCRQTPLAELHCCACRGCGEPMLLAWDGQTKKYGGMCPVLRRLLTPKVSRRRQPTEARIDDDHRRMSS